MGAQLHPTHGVVPIELFHSSRDGAVTDKKKISVQQTKEQPRLEFGAEKKREWREQKKNFFPRTKMASASINQRVFFSHLGSRFFFFNRDRFPTDISICSISAISKSDMEKRVDFTKFFCVVSFQVEAEI